MQNTKAYQYKLVHRNREIANMFKHGAERSEIINHFGISKKTLSRVLREQNLARERNG